MTAAPITNAITEAIDEIRSSFPTATVTVEEDGAGGAWITVDSVPLGPAYVQDNTTIAFQITFPYPEGDVYPHFVRRDLSRADGAALGTGFSVCNWGPSGGRPGVQLSRRSPRWNPDVDTAAIKVIKVIKWLDEQ